MPALVLSGYKLSNAFCLGSLGGNAPPIKLNAVPIKGKPKAALPAKFKIVVPASLPISKP